MRRPWYGFLYRLLGAQGSFFAWVISLFGVYVTANEAVLWATNPAPATSRVADILEKRPALRRWVRIAGAEIDLASPLLAAAGRAAAAGAVPGADRVLVDRDSAEAKAWREVLEAIEAVKRDLEGPADDDAIERLKRLQVLIFRIDDDRRSYVPERALVVIAREDPFAAAPPPAPAGQEAISDSEVFRRKVRARVDLIRRSVRVDVEREGILERLPERRRESYKGAHGVAVAPAALGVGHRPSTLAAEVFGLCVVTLLFLVAGLRGGGPS